MPEGIDQAAEAFHTEINPQRPERPRDESGRFSSTGRPETMFEPRPLEGDPLTGDVRDGGEDARLTARERRVADGWAEEGDANELRKPVPDNAARARHAPADGRHERGEAEPERIGSEDERDQDAQGQDGKPKAEGDEGDAEGPSEPDADGADWQVTLDGKPVEKLEVNVDGETHEVTLQEALKGYVDGETYNRRVAQVGQAVQVIDSEYQRATQLRDAYIQQLAAHEEEYLALLPKEPNWDQFYAQDPKAAYEVHKNYQAAQNVLNGIRGRRAEQMQMAQAEQARRIQEYANNGWEEFKRNAKFADQVQLNNELSAMRRAGQEYGFAEQELSTVYDPRMLAVLHDASKYRRMTANKPRPVMPDKGRTLAPGSARPIGSATRRSIDDAHRQLAKSGRLSDAAVLFQRLIR